MTRTEHLAWAKARALALVDVGNLADAYASLASDMKNHPGLKDHAGLGLGWHFLMAGHLDTREKLRDFIEGFH